MLMLIPCTRRSRYECASMEIWDFLGGRVGPMMGPERWCVLCPASEACTLPPPPRPSCWDAKNPGGRGGGGGGEGGLVARQTLPFASVNEWIDSVEKWRGDQRGCRHYRYFWPEKSSVVAVVGLGGGGGGMVWLNRPLLQLVHFQSFKETVSRDRYLLKF
jgi:hypothetical protein